MYPEDVVTKIKGCSDESNEDRSKTTDVCEPASWKGID